MGAGKTYMGRSLADRLGFHFLDLDEWLEEKEQRSIAAIFKEDGEMEFRKKEAACLRNTVRFQNIVIATGGGAPCYFDNMDWMNEKGVSIYLEAKPEVLAARLAGVKAKRPLIANLTEEGLHHFIEEKIAERGPFYRQAHLRLEVPQDGNDACDELAGYLKRFLRQK